MVEGTQELREATENVLSNRGDPSHFEDAARLLRENNQRTRAILRSAKENIDQAIIEARNKPKEDFFDGIDQMLSFVQHGYKLITSFEAIYYFVDEEFFPAPQTPPDFWITELEPSIPSNTSPSEKTASTEKDDGGGSGPNSENEDSKAEFERPIGPVAEGRSDIYRRAKTNLDWLQSKGPIIEGYSDNEVVNEADKRVVSLLNDIAELQGFGPEYSKDYERNDVYDFDTWGVDLLEGIERSVRLGRLDPTVPFAIIFDPVELGDATIGNPQAVRELHKDTSDYLGNFWFWRTGQPLLNPWDFGTVDINAIEKSQECAERGCISNQ